MSSIISANNLPVPAVAAAAALSLLVLKYRDQALFSRIRNDIPKVPGAPLVGSLFSFISSLEKMLDFDIKQFKDLDTMTTYVDSQ